MATLGQDERERLAREGRALPGGRFPIRNRADLIRAIRAVGRAKGGEPGREAVRRFIIRRARALGLTDLVPETWNQDGSLKS